MERQSRVLVVDDDPFALRSIAKVLGGESYQIVTAASGSEAIDLLKQDSFDLVLTDLKMPGVDGFEVLRHAREIAPQAMVLILTRYTSLESAIEALREGAYDYLVKPCSGDELKLKIERGLERVRLAEERQRAEEEIKRRNEELAALNAITTAVSQSLDLKETMDAALKETLAVLNAEGGVIHLFDETSQTFAPVVHHGLSRDVLRDVTGLKQGEGLSGWVAESGEALVIADLAVDPRNISPAAVQEGWHAYAGVPIESRGKVVGVMTLVTRQEGYLKSEQVGLLSHIGNQISVAIENAQLYEETRRRALEQETASRIAYALNIPDVREAFPILVEGLQDLTGCDEVSLIALDEAGEQLITTVLKSSFSIPGEGDVMPLSDTSTAKDIRAGRPHLTADLGTEAHFPLEQALHRAGLRSRVTLPLLIGGEVFGALNLGGSDTGLFRKEQLPVLRQITDSLALALQNSFIFQAEREQRERAEALEAATAIVSSTLDPDQVLDRILEQVSRVVPNDATNIMLIEGDQVRIVRWRGYERFGAKEFVSTVAFRISEVPNLQQMLESGEPMVIPDTATYPGWIHIPVQKWLRSYAAVPIVVRDEVIGFLNVDSATPGFFTQAHTETLRAFADAAAAAIENARLYEEEQERRHIAETLRQASTVLSSTLELDEVLGLILQQLRQVIPYDSTSVQQLQDEYLEIVACQGFEEPSKVVGLVFPLDPKFPNYRVITTKAPLATEDVTKDYPHFKNEANTYESGRIRSWLGVPLMVKGEVIGMIAVDRAKVQPYTAEEEQLAMAFANQAAIAIENAHLFEEIEERRMYLEGVLRAAPDAIVTLDAHHKIVEWNPGAEGLFGYSREEVIGHDIDPLVTNCDTIEEANDFRQIVTSGKDLPPVATVRYRKDGSPVDVLLAASPIAVKGELTGIVAIYTDITEHKQAEMRLVYMATHDPLTGMPNRRGFFTLAEQQLKTANRTKRKMLLLFADFDGLKQVNDAFGHPTGDRALIETANVLRETFRESDIVARIGGDEFVVLAIETDGFLTENLTTRLQQNLEAHNAREGRLYKLSLSMGQANYDPEHPCSVDELLAQADRAMYERKGDR